MNRFEFARAGSVAEARSLVAEKPGAVLKAGGIDLVDHLKEHLVEPSRVVDLKAIPGLRGIAPQPDGSLRIGPLSTLAEVARYAAQLGGMTQGQGSYTMELSHYEMVPANVQQHIVSTAKLKDEDDE